MATPAYLGSGQPTASYGSGFLGRLGSLFDGGTPQYLGEGQPSPNRGILGNVTPAYMAAPEVVPAQSIEPLATCASCPIDPNALAAGCIAIVIPREDAASDREDQVAATD